jgi:DNA-binding transcriptional LysR family regulator
LWLLPRLGNSQKEHPDIDIPVTANNRVLDLESENIDLAIRYWPKRACPRAQPACSARWWRRSPARMWRDTHSATSNGLLDQTFLELDERSRPWLRWSAWLTARGLGGARPKTYLHFNQYDQVIQAVVEGHGVALGRLGLILPMIDDGRLVAQPSGKNGASSFAYWLTKQDRAWRNEVQLFAE